MVDNTVVDIKSRVPGRTREDTEDLRMAALSIAADIPTPDLSVEERGDIVVKYARAFMAFINQG